MSMSRAVLITAALAAAAAGAAIAQTATQDVNLSAIVPKYCKFDGVPTFGSLNNVTATSVGIASSVLRVTSATSTSGIMNPAGFNVTIPATCNFPSQVTFTSVNGGLKDGTPTPVVSGTFLSRIDYTATLFNWDGAPTVALSTNGTANATVSTLASTAHTGSLQALVNFQHNTTAPLAAGDYSDILRISLSPQ